MEVALRAMNLLAAFEFFRHSRRNLTFLQFFLRLLQQHGNYIAQSRILLHRDQQSLSFGRRWTAVARVIVPELRDATRWRDFGLRQMLREMDKQVLADGADFRIVDRLSPLRYRAFSLFVSALPGQWNRDREEVLVQGFEQMLFTSALTCARRFAPLIGDTDSGQVCPVLRRRADDHAYLWIRIPFLTTR